MDLNAQLVNAAFSLNTKDLERLLAEGADVNGKDSDGNTAMVGVLDCKPDADMREALAVLLRHGADARLPLPSGHSPLQKAVQYGDLELVKMLVEAGADPHAQVMMDEEPWNTCSLLFDAAQFPEITQYLVGLGLDLEDKLYNGHTPLIVAIEDDLEGAGVLIQAGAQVNVQNTNGKPLLQLALENENPKALLLVEQLLNAGADVGAVSRHAKETALHAAATHCHWAIPLLLQHQADIEARDRIGMTPLMHAVRYGTVEAFEALHEAGADIHATDVFGYAVVMLFSGRPETVEIMERLRKAGANLLALDHEGGTALHRAAKMGNLPVIDYLLGKGLDPRAVDFAGSTPLDVASDRGSRARLEMELLKGDSNQELQPAASSRRNRL